MRYLYILLVVFIVGCSPTKVIVLNSSNFFERAQRIEILEKEIISKTIFTDAEFVLFNVNGFQDSTDVLPGASSWDYKFALKVAPSNIEEWIEDFNEVEAFDYSWIDEVIELRKENWKTNSEPHYFSKGDVYLVLFYEEGIVFKRVIQN